MNCCRCCWTSSRKDSHHVTRKTWGERSQRRSPSFHLYERLIPGVLSPLHSLCLPSAEIVWGICVISVNGRHCAAKLVKNLWAFILASSRFTFLYFIPKKWLMIINRKFKGDDEKVLVGSFVTESSPLLKNVWHLIASYQFRHPRCVGLGNFPHEEICFWEDEINWTHCDARSCIHIIWLKWRLDLAFDRKGKLLGRERMYL